MTKAARRQKTNKEDGGNDGRVGIILTSPEGLIIDINADAGRILQVSRSNFEHKNIAEIFESPDTYHDWIASLPAGGRLLNKPLVIMAADGRKQVVSFSVHSFSEQDQQRCRYMLREASPLKPVEERLIQDERLTSVARFASQVAHDIRNPLGSIVLNLELLESEIPQQPGGEARSLIRSVLKETDRLNDIVTGYLQFSRPKVILKPQPIDGVLKSFVDDFPCPPGVNIELAEVPPGHTVWVDERLMRQVMEHFVRNGIQAIDPPGTIHIETEIKPGLCGIHVRDNGHGMSPELQKKLFEPFFTTRTLGTGLGLALARQIVFEHNGHVAVESRSGIGSTFSIWLPYEH